MIRKPEKKKQGREKYSDYKEPGKNRLRRIRRHGRKFTMGAAYGLLLTGFTVYIVLDTFVIKNTYQTNTVQMNMELFETKNTAASLSAVSDPDAADDEANLSDTAGKAGSASGDVNEEASDTENVNAENNASLTEAEYTASETSETGTETESPRGRSSKKQRHGSGISQGQNNESAGSTAVFSDSAGVETVLSEFADQSIADPVYYEDDNVKITLSEYVENDTHIYAADVVLTSAQYLKTAFAENAYGKNITAATSVIASEHDAVLAINGDYYGSQESGYVIRNGIVYRDESDGSDVLCIYADGTMKILDSDDYTAQELADQGVWQTLCFGPGLLENGQITVSETEEVGKAKASNPRTAIGMIDENHYLFVVSDGRTQDSEGLSLYELAEFMQDQGVVTAYNLDGGGSSTMVFQGELVNNPTSGRSVSERSVSDIVYIG